MTQSFFNLNSQAREGEVGIFYGNLLKRLIRADITWSFFPPISSPASPVQMSPIHIDNIVTASYLSQWPPIHLYCFNSLALLQNPMVTFGTYRTKKQVLSSLPCMDHNNTCAKV